MCLLLILTYGSLQMIKLALYDETAIMHSSRDSYYKGHEIIEDNLQFAFALTTYDDVTEVQEDPTIATLEASYRKWGWSDAIEEYLEPIESHFCTNEELGIKFDSELEEYVIDEENRDGTSFFPPHQQATSDITYYNKKFRCID